MNYAFAQYAGIGIQLTPFIMQQLENIQTTSINILQWRWLGELDQSLSSFSDVKFNSAAIPSITVDTIAEYTLNNGVDLETVHFDSGNISNISSLNGITSDEIKYLDGLNQYLSTASDVLFQTVGTTQGVYTDTITEYTPNNGVDIESVHFEDGYISNVLAINSISNIEFGFLDGLNQYLTTTSDVGFLTVSTTQGVFTDTITEYTLNNGVDLESVHFEDGNISGVLSIVGDAKSGAFLNVADSVGNIQITNTQRAFGTAGNNIILGIDGLASITTNEAKNNVAIGTQALQFLTTGDANVSVGISAGRNNTTGSNCVYVGNLCGDSHQVGSANVFIGDEVLDNGQLTNVSNSTYVGMSAGYFPEGGATNGNIAIGRSALQHLGDLSDYNTACGYQAMGNVTPKIDSDFCVALGYRALYNIGSAARANVALGAAAGDTIITGTNNLLLGHDADTLAADSTYSLAIGYSARAASNQIRIGNTTNYYSLECGSQTGNFTNARFGDLNLITTLTGEKKLTFTDTSANITGSVYIENRLGIQNITPAAILDVQPTATTTTTYARPVPILSTAQANTLAGMAEGVGYWNTDLKNIYVYDGSIFRPIRAITTVYVSALSDLPAPIGGSITLAMHTDYRFLSSTFINFGATNLICQERSWLYNAHLTFTTGYVDIQGDVTFEQLSLQKLAAGNLFITSNPTLINNGDVIRFERSLIYHFGATGTVFNLSGSTPQALFILSNTVVSGYPIQNDGQNIKVATVQVIGVIINIVRVFYTVGGFEFINCALGITVNLLEERYQKVGIAANLLSLSGQIQAANISGYFPEMQPLQYAFFISPTLLFNSIVISNCPIITTYSQAANVWAPTSLNQTTRYIKVSGCVSVPDSKVSATTYFYNSVATTQIYADNNYVKIQETYTSENLERTIVGNDGLITYTGTEQALILKGQSNICMEPSFGQNIKLIASFIKAAYPPYAIKFDNIADRIITAFPPPNGSYVLFISGIGGSLPVGIYSTVLYYTLNQVAGLSFQIAYNNVSPPITFIDDGVQPNDFRNCYIINGKSEIRASNGISVTATALAVVSMNPNDSLLVMVSNATNANNIIASSAYVSVTS